MDAGTPHIVPQALPDTPPLSKAKDVKEGRTLRLKNVPVLVRTSLSCDSPDTLSSTTDLVIVGRACAAARRMLKAVASMDSQPATPSAGGGHHGLSTCLIHFRVLWPDMVCCGLETLRMTALRLYAPRRRSIGAVTADMMKGHSSTLLEPQVGTGPAPSALRGPLPSE